MIAVIPLLALPPVVMKLVHEFYHRVPDSVGSGPFTENCATRETEPSAVFRLQCCGLERSLAQ